MNNCPKISIIVPIYNVAPYLRQCMDSIIQQTYPNIEIICVDDGSTDESGTIADEYAKKDSRVRVIHQSNGGVSSARNIALPHISGKYVIFVDGDDWLAPNTCALAMSHDTDLVMWAYTREYPEHCAPKQVFEKERQFRNAECHDLLRRMVGLSDEELAHPENADALSTVWGKLYRADIIAQHQLRFTDLQRIGTYEDGFFNLSYISYIDSAVYVPTCLYHYRKNTGMTARYRESLAQQWKNLFKDMLCYIGEREHNAPDLLQALNNRISLSIIGLGLNAIACPNRKAITEIREILADPNYRKAVKTLPMRYFPPHWWVFFLCCKLRLTYGVFLLLKCMERMKG